MSDDMISVPRELLERILQGCMFTLGSEQYGEIKALLAQPNTCTKDGGQCGLGGYCEPCQSVEPVAWCDESEMRRMESGGVASLLVAGTKRPFYAEPLYRHPPAQAQQPLTHAPNCPNCPPPGATHTISGQFYRKAEGAWLVYGHKRDWVPSDAPAGWNDENLVPLLPPAQAQMVLPQGWVLVPAKPTSEMVAAGKKSFDFPFSLHALRNPQTVYQAFIESAPACLDEFKRLNPGIEQ